MKCFYCGKEIDQKKSYIEAAGGDGVKIFCPGPVNMSAYEKYSEPTAEEKEQISKQGLCFAAYRIGRIMLGHLTSERFVNP